MTTRSAGLRRRSRAAGALAIVVAAALQACVGEGGGGGGGAKAGEAAMPAGDTASASPIADAAPSDAAFAPPLEGTEWRLFALPGEAVPPEVRATLAFTRETGLLHGHTGCREFDGAYRIEGARITLSLSGLGAGACPEGGAEVEAAYLDVLPEVGSWRLLADTLELMAERGVVARFTAPAPGER